MFYDWKVREDKLEVGEKVLIHALGPKEKSKLLMIGRNLDTLYLEVPIENIPVLQNLSREW